LSEPFRDQHLSEDGREITVNQKTKKNLACFSEPRDVSTDTGPLDLSLKVSITRFIVGDPNHRIASHAKEHAGDRGGRRMRRRSGDPIHSYHVAWSPNHISAHKACGRRHKRDQTKTVQIRTARRTVVTLTCLLSDSQVVVLGAASVTFASADVGRKRCCAHQVRRASFQKCRAAGRPHDSTRKLGGRPAAIHRSRSPVVKSARATRWGCTPWAGR
jgi:hypothetical protein